MSFELTLTPKSGPLDAESFDALFAGRPHYQPGEDQAAYQNDDTGVYFLLDLEDGAVRFSINTRRSDIFAEEAAEELTAIFGGDEFGFSAGAFLADWRAANAAAVAAFIAEGGRPLTLPFLTNLAVWRWNRDVPRRQQELEDEATVPPLKFLIGPDGNPRPTYLWLVTVPTIKPLPAEAVLLADVQPLRLRDRLLGHEPPIVTIGTIVIRWLRDLAFPVWRPIRAQDLIFSLVPSGDRNPAILATMASAHAYAKPPGAPVKVDQILDRETVEKARAALED